MAKEVNQDYLLSAIKMITHGKSYAIGNEMDIFHPTNSYSIV